MYVSYLELYTHCKKVFLAHGIPDGCAEDGAEAVAWGEFCGLNAYEALAAEVKSKKIKGDIDIEVRTEQDAYFCLDAGGQSHIVIGRLIAEYACAKSKEQANSVVHVEHIVTSNALAGQAHYLAKKGKASLFRFNNIANIPTWILATPDEVYPLIVSGHAVDQMITEHISEHMSARLNETCLHEPEENQLTIFILEDNFVAELIKTCHSQDQQLVNMITADFMKRNLEQAHENGKFIKRDLWEQLNEIGAQTLVEASELSRLRGTGELA